MRSGPLLALAGIFAPLSFSTIGGGQSIISEIHRQVVDVHGWITEDGFLTIFALSRLAPGPGALIVTLVGWAVAGWQGALVTSIAIFLPSSILLYGLARLWARHRGARWQRAIETGLAPVAAGLILASAWTIARAARGGPEAWVVTAASTFVLSTTKTSPFVVLGIGAAVFLAAYYLYG